MYAPGELHSIFKTGHLPGFYDNREHRNLAVLSFALYISLAKHQKHRDPGSSVSFKEICQNFIGSRHGCDANIIEVYTYPIVMIISNSVKNTPWVYKSMGNYAILPNVSKYTFSFQTKL